MKITIYFVFVFISFSLSSQNKTEKYIQKYSSIAVDEMNRYKIPASITLAQGILESGNGESRLAVEGKNHFGIKCHNNWNGETIIEDDDKKNECFRKYSKVSDSFRDHSLFLSERGRYSFLFDYPLNDYKKWARGLKKAGYATNPNYPSLLIDLIEKYNLDKYDNRELVSKNFYFAHSYGFPYLTGLGIYYFNHNSLYILETNTSFVFSEGNGGYHYEFFSNFYFGSNFGIIYLPTEQENFVPQIASEIMYMKKNILFRTGLQIPLKKIDYNLIPFIRLTYLIN